MKGKWRVRLIAGLLSLAFISFGGAVALAQGTDERTAVPPYDLAGSLIEGGNCETAVPNIAYMVPDSVSLSGERANSGEKSIKYDKMGKDHTIGLVSSAIKPDTDYSFGFSAAGEQNCVLVFEPVLVVYTNNGWVQAAGKSSLQQGGEGFHRFTLNFRYSLAGGNVSVEIPGMETDIAKENPEGTYTAVNNVEIRMKLHYHLTNSQPQTELNATDSVYFDDISLFEEYTGGIYVIDAEMKNVEDAVFEAVGFDGAAVTLPEPVYEDGKYVFAGLLGPVTVTAKDGTETVGTVKLNSGSTTAFTRLFEFGLDITDQTGAKLSDVSCKLTGGEAEFSEEAEGYRLAGISGDVSILLYKAGYETVEKDIVIDLSGTEELADTIHIVMPAAAELSNDYNNFLNGNFEAFDNFTTGQLLGSPWYAYSLAYAYGGADKVPAGSVETVVEQDEETVFAGSKSVKVTYGSMGGGVPIDLAYRRGTPNYELGKKVFVQGWVKSAEKDVTLDVYISFGPSHDGGVPYIMYPAFTANKDYWTKLSFWFEVNGDAAAKTLTLSTGSGGTYTYANWDGDEAFLAALDIKFRGTKGDVCYFDSFSMTDEFDAAIHVKDVSGQAAEAEKIELFDYNGTPVLAEPVYAAGTYTYNGLSMPVKAVVRIGGQEITTKLLNAKESEITVSPSYTSVITLKDSKGEAVRGATVAAKQGTALKPFTDNGDGTYTLAGLSGSVTVVVSKTGYTFDDVTVTGTDTNKTVTAKTEPSEPVTPPEGDEPGGCSCGGGEAAAGVAVLLAAAGLAIGKFRF